jgi:general L-amino acid transport system permease protein
MAEDAFSRTRILPPPSERTGPWNWARKNLFSTWYDTLLTLAALAVIYIVLRPVLAWVLTQARWGVILVNLRLFMTGTYPLDQLWRVWLVLHFLAAVGGLTWGVWVRGRRVLAAIFLLIPIFLAIFVATSLSSRLHLGAFSFAALIFYLLGRMGGRGLARTVIGAWVLYFPLVILIIGGLTPRGGPFPVVPTNFWGGLLLTFLLTVVGILFSFPLGVLLALGRRSTLPLIRWMSVAYIEIIRGVPLITILFMASTMVPLFLPGGVNIDRVLRAMVGITLFSAAYLAENVRGGLQAIPRGQFEAAHALGLNGALTMGLIIMPQALRLVIPVLVGQFISLFKDTTLVATIGLLDLLGIARSVLAQPQFISYQHEVLVFITFVYWIISYLMALISRRLEVALGVGVR